MHVNQARYISNSQQFETAYFFTAEGECSEMRNLPMQCASANHVSNVTGKSLKWLLLVTPRFPNSSGGCCSLLSSLLPDIASLPLW